MKRSHIIIILTILLAGVTSARTWVNNKGVEIEAEYVSSDSTHVSFKLKGKVISYPLTQLSENDQDWIKTQTELNKKKNEEKLEGLLGFRDNVPIDGRLFPVDADYFKERTRKSCVKACEAGAASNTGKLEDWIKRNDDKDRCIIYCPPSYDGSEAYGLYLHVHSGSNGFLKKEWFPLFDRLKLIAVSANDAGNYVTGSKKDENPYIRRVFLSISALATVEKHYKIDPTRRIVGGTSGGGHMSFLTASLFPELFKGALSSAAQSYMPGHFPGLTIKDFKRKDRKTLKWVVVSGNKDRNYQEILKTSKVWEANRLNYRFLDVPGMGHQPYTVEPFEEALKWIGITEEKK